MPLKRIILNSVPIAIGYSFLGFTFGLLWSSKGGSFLSSFLVATFGFTGAGQFIALEFMGENPDYWLFLITTLVLGARHTFYGLISNSNFGPFSLKKIYLIGALTDENFGMLQYYKNHMQPDAKFLFQVFLINHLYWIIGCSVGSFASSFIPNAIKGLEFSLTALFIVMAIDSVKSAIRSYATKPQSEVSYNA